MSSKGRPAKRAVLLPMTDPTSPALRVCGDQGLGAFAQRLAKVQKQSQVSDGQASHLSLLVRDALPPATAAASAGASGPARTRRSPQACHEPRLARGAISARAEIDSLFAQSLLAEAATLFLQNEPVTARLIFRDLLC